MDGLGFETFRSGGTGVVAVLRNGEGPVVGFRADIDALPVLEETGLEYASTARGTLPDGTEVPVMHACGHDTHITCAIGAATLLVRASDTWSGTVVFLFQERHVGPWQPRPCPLHVGLIVSFSRR